MTNEKTAPAEVQPQPLRHHEVHAWALQMHIMQSSGVPLITSLESLSRSEIPRMAPASALLVKRLLAGHSLSMAVHSIQPAFSPFVVNMIEIGEKSGHLATVLQRISLRSARRDKMERGIKGALAYPFFLAVVSIAMALFMAFYMFPKMLPFLTGLGVELPAPTRLLIWATGNLSSLLLIFTILAVGAARLLANGADARVARARQWLLYQSPVIGPLNQERVYADCFSDLNLLLEAGCDLLSSLKLLHSPWVEHNERVSKCIELIRAGAEFGEAGEESALFPRRFMLQIKSGEESGQLPHIFKIISQQLDEQVNYRIAGIVAVAEPAIFMIMGVVTGFVVLATFLPLYSLTSSAL
jgi:type IV pilus assembly protein PilC